ncbi:lipopolysaccharide transport system permease protein [Paraburkholderia sp. WSM4179]|nr:lipopolysaccharide transport system permease protein [Paraburkholderia sp. WSM4179]
MTRYASIHDDASIFNAKVADSVMYNLALYDLKRSIASWRLWTLLGWLEVRQRYARSRVGPFWLTISTGVMVGSIGVVYGTLFGMKMSDYLPYLAVSLVLWTTFSATVLEGSTAYINSGHYIRQAATPKLIFMLQVAWRNLIILAHNFVIVVVLLAIYGIKSWETLPVFIPALVLYMANAMWMAMVTGLLSARFRDLPQIVSALMQIAFYVTPIIYHPNSLTRFSFIVDLNPLAHLVELVRAPLIGEWPSATTWGVAVGLAVAGWLLALALTGRYLKRIPYWV